ncbi:MAG TPA: hypothetical protein VE401_09020 [Solirubrobacterales bacterium]|nr:hypothetical protein [Solirubrobacterales bacterium]
MARSGRNEEEARISERAGVDYGDSGSPSQAPSAARRRAAARTVISGLLALAAALLLAPGAQARLEFPPAQTLSPAGSFAENPQVAIDSQDRAIVVWDAGLIQSVRLGADDSGETVQDLAADGSSPQVAVDALGRATVVWRNFSDDRVQALRLEADGNPGVLHTLSEAAAFDPQVAVDPQGRAAVVWRRRDPATGAADSRIESLRIAADGIPGTVRTLSGAGASDPQVAVDPQGRATVVWRLTRGRRGIQSVRLGADGTPGAVRTLSKTKAFSPQVAVDSRGRSTAVWATGGALRPGRIKSLRLGANGTAGASKTLSKARADSPRVAVDSQRRATVVWSRRMRTRSGGAFLESSRSASAPAGSPARSTPSPGGAGLSPVPSMRTDPR